jgi:hypothetical protein
MVAMSLSCSGGIKVVEDPGRASTGQIQTATGDSFFDVFILIQHPLLGTLRNPEPARVHSTIAHIPPLGSVYFGVRPVALVDQAGQPVGTLTHVAHHTNGVPKPESSGEVSRIFSCFYECKMDRTSTGVLRWTEVTSLMLVNQSVKRPITADILFVDGHERPLARSRTALSPLDVDEINVCATLDDAGLFPVPAAAGFSPLAGLIEVLLSPAGGVYGWVKNATGKIPRTRDDPMSGAVTGIGKTECRLVGPNVVTPAELEQVLAVTPAVIPPVFIENTGE